MDIKQSVRVSNAMAKTNDKQLAQHIGISAVWLCKLFVDNSARHVEKMSDFYDIPVSVFIARGEP